MKLNIANPATGCQKIVDIEDDKKLHIFFDKRIAQEVDISSLGDKFKGYVVRITGGSDKQGFPMKQGVLVNGRVRLLLDGNSGCFHPRRGDGLRRRKSVRGAIVGPDLGVLNLIIVKKGAEEIDGLTNKTIPRRLGPKRASKIRKLFALTKDDDVRQYVIRRQVPRKSKDAEKPLKPRSKAPKIQRLVTPLTLQRKRRRLALKEKKWVKAKEEALKYAQLVRKLNQSKNAKKRPATSPAKAPAAKKAKTEAKPSPKKEVKAEKKDEKKAAPKKVEAKKEAPKKAEAKKEAPKKAEAKKEAPKKAEAKKEAPKKAEPKKEPKKEAKKEAPKKAEPKKEAPKKAEPKKAEPKKEAPKKAEPKKAEPKKEAPKKAEAKKPAKK